MVSCNKLVDFFICRTERTFHIMFWISMQFIILVSNSVRPSNQSSSNILTDPQRDNNEAEPDGMSYLSDNICFLYVFVMV
jgi:hypothetical protein